MPTIREQFLDSLQRLALSPEAQIAYLRSLGDVSVDELALDYDGLLPAVLRHLDPSVREALQRLDDYLDEISGPDPALWTFDAVRSAPEWACVRELARDALRRLQEVEPE